MPHGRHVHALLARGRWYLDGHRLRQAPAGLVVLCASRPPLEGHARARVRALPNVAFLDDIYEAVRDAEPLDDPVAFRFRSASGTATSGWTASPTGCW